MTSLRPIRPDFEVPAGTWVKDAAHSGVLPSPFLASLGDPSAAVFADLAERAGLLVETVRTGVIGYETYVQAVPLGGAGGAPPPRALVWLLSRLHPAFRRRTAAARHALATDFDDAPSRWRREWEPALRRRFAEHLAVDPGALADDRLLAEIDEVLTLAADGVGIHFDLFLPYLLGLHGLVEVCTELLGWDSSTTLRMLTGSSEASAAPAVAMRSLAEAAVDDEAAVAALADRSPGGGQRLREVSPRIADLLDRWLDDWGHRCMDYDPAAPTYAEKPELVTHLLRQSMAAITAGGCRREGGGPGGSTDAGPDLVADARSLLAGSDLDRFESVLAEARRVHPLREDNVHLTSTMPAALLRRLVVEAGKRLVDRGRLTAVGDVFLAEKPELEAALMEPTLDLRPAVTRRRAEMAWVEEHPGPDSYGPPEGEPPDLTALPEPLRRVNAALIWAMDLEFAPAGGGGGDGGVVTGIGVSPGRAVGRVRLIRTEEDFFDMVEGEVVVCRVATTAWSPLLGIAGAIVCDTGGALSHTAVIARELGVPAVLGTGNATTSLVDGAEVVVDGHAGVVERLSP